MSEKRQKRPTQLKKTLLGLMHYFYAYRLRLTVVAVCMVVGSICTARGTYYLKPAINDFIIPFIGQQNPDFSEFMLLLSKMAALYLISVAGVFVQSRIMVSISNDTMYRIRTDMFQTMQRLPLKYFDAHSTGEILSYYSNDVDTLSNMLRQSLPKILDGSVTCIFVMITIFCVNYQLAFIVLFCEVMLVLILKALVKRNARHFANQQSGLGTLNAFTEEIIGGMNEIKAFGQEKSSVTRFRKINDQLFESVSKADFYSNSIFCLTNGLSNIGFAIIAVSGGIMSIYGMADIGTVGIFLQYYRSLYNPLTNMSKQFNNILGALAGAERIFNFIDSESEIDDGRIQLIDTCADHDGVLVQSDVPTGCYGWLIMQPDGRRIIKPYEGKIRFQNVDFGYSEDRIILHDFNLDIMPGQKTAFVGSTGAGKTTVTNLFNRFYEIKSGKITWDEIDIRDIRKSDLRKMTDIVLQDIHLFTGSVEENIRFGHLEASKEDIRAACQIANADNFIDNLPDGYDTVLSHDGENLSQGQRQLLSLARAAVSTSPVLILDEATSSIDTRTEAIIEKGLDSLMKGRTVFVIAHRLSTIRNADRIIVLDHGRIKEAGTHQELLAKKGMYFRLCAGMSELA